MLGGSCRVGVGKYNLRKIFGPACSDISILLIIHSFMSFYLFVYSLEKYLTYQSEDELEGMGQSD